MNQRVEDNFFGQVHQLMMPNQVLENKTLIRFHAIIPFSTLIRGYRRLKKATKRGIRDVRWTPSKVFIYSGYGKVDNIQIDLKIIFQRYLKLIFMTNL